MHNNWEQDAAPQKRIELSSSRAGLGSRANSSENVLTSTSSLVYDDKENGPRSCPTTFNDGNRHKISLSKRRQPRGGELIVSKLQPTRDNVNNMLTYVHELQMSEASLRKELLKTKRRTEEELNQSLLKLSELQRTMQEVEWDRKRSRRRLEKKEQRIRELAAKLERAETTQHRARPGRRNIFSIDGLPQIAEEDTLYNETEPLPTDQPIPPQESKRLEDLSETPPALTVEALLPPSQQNQLSKPILHPIETSKDKSTQSAIISPRSPNRPLWDPWASGGTASMKDLPPIFTIGSTGFDPEVTSVAVYGTTMVEDYELKSVLLSPRQGQDLLDNSSNVCQEDNDQQQKRASPALPLDQHEGVSFATLNSSPVIRTDSLLPPPPHSHQQNCSPPEKQVAAHEQMLENMAIMELSSQYDATVPPSMSLVSNVGAMSPIRVDPNEQQDTNTANDDSEFDVWNGFPDQQDVHISAAGVATGKEDSSPTSVVTDLPLQSPLQASPCVPYTQFNATDPSEEMSSQLFPPSKVQPNRVASASRDMIEVVQSKPVSLETLLVDFFTEVDNKRLKMAKVYGKRYAGREKWLFAELSKRYGATKVAALKFRFDDGSGGSTSAVTNHCKGSNDPHASNSSNVSTHAKAGRQVHPRHPPTPASNVDLSAGAGVSSVASSVAPFQEKDESRSQIRQVAEEINTGSSPSKQTSANSISPQKCPTGSNISSLSGPPPSLPTLQETGEGDNATAVGTDGATFRSGPARRTRHGEPTSQFNQLSSRPQTENSNTPPVGLRQRHQLSAGSQTSTGVERPDVTLEGLLKELYKTHQPDKLKNVSIVAKQYAGRERELVGLLKGKYGVLSVKRLEENLDSLERTHRAHMSKNGTRKKRGCFVRTVSLVFWFTVLLNFSFGAVFVSFVVLNAWGCRSFDSEEQELEAAGDCLPLKKELETFTYERIATYVVQSHPDACFCSEWKARESALFDTFSGEDLVKLARLVAFSPVSFGVPWIAIVKEQVPSQTFYDSYAKPVVDLSLDAGIFAWSSVLELAGYIEVSAMSTAVKNAVDSYFGETAEVDNKRFADNVNADVLPIEEAQVVDGEAIAVAPGLLEQVLVKEELDTFDENRKTDSLETSDRATGLTDNVLMEDDVSEGMTTASEEGFSLLSETDGEELATVESINVLKMEEVPLVEVAESIDAGEQDSFDEAEGEETWTDASIPAEEAESAADADDGTSAFTETEEEDVDVENSSFNDIEEVSEAESIFGTDEGVFTFTETEEADDAVENTTLNDIEEVSEAELAGGTNEEVSAFTEIEEADDAVENTTLNDIEKVAEAAVEVNEEMSAEDVITVSEGVVEVEVRQDGIDLSYAKSEMDEALTAESAESSILSVDTESDLLFGGGEEPSAISDETEVLEDKDTSEDVVVDAAEEDIAPVMEGVDEDFAAPTSSVIEADVEKTNLGSDIATASEVVEIEAENVGKEPEVLQMEPSHALSLTIELVLENSGWSNFTNAEELALKSAVEEIAASSLSEGPESEADKELDDLTKAEAQETETMSDEEEGVSSEEDDANIMVEDDFIVTNSELEPSFSSIGSDDENTAYVEQAEVNEHIEDAGYVRGCTSEGGEDVIVDENEIPVNDTDADANVLTDRENASATSAENGPNHNDDDGDENEEIAFMLGLENPDELLRLAEQAAAATIETTETR
ncbi:unnamed protein product [Peronospora farinosa]|uniref:Uncharacterized protein n=1 Tax=Peronospora farinosa TaxID=134698 RepID=A0ABN8CBN3_9STRA|nr:unnamed protein product [Peronospora farinosa]